MENPGTPEPYATGYTAKVPNMLRALIANVPTRPSQKCPAQNVLGHICVYDTKRRLILGPVVGHWTETAWPTGNQRAQSITLDANAGAHPIDLLFKYLWEEECYIVPAEVAEKAKGGWQDYPLSLGDLQPGGGAAMRNREYRLAPGRYSVGLRLYGDNVDQTRWLEVENKGRGTDVSACVSTAPKPRIPRLK